jgi:predicted PhzF superfamily epimerase YddE/YHI9
MKSHELKVDFEITQGVEIGRRSNIGISVTADSAGAIQTIVLRGSAVKVMQGRVDVEM